MPLFCFFPSGCFPQSDTDLWHVGEPLQDGENTLKVVRHRGVCDSVVVHDLHTTQLVVGGVNLTTKNLKYSREKMRTEKI